MITSSPTLAAMRLGVEAVERRSDFEDAALRLRRAREDAERLQAARARARDAALEGE
ncbi:MAG: hypothetical protein AAGF90_22035 [Pseudomonadota bacterium]